MAAAPAFDLRVGITWTQKGLPELLQQARQELSRLTSAASTGSVTGSTGKPATQKEVNQFLSASQAELAREAKQFGAAGEKAVRQMFKEIRAALNESRTTATAAKKSARQPTEEAAAKKAGAAPPPKKPPTPSAGPAAPPPEPKAPRTAAQKAAAAAPKAADRDEADRVADLVARKQRRAADRAAAEQVLKGDTDYIASQKSIIKSKQSQATAAQAGLATDNEYRDEQVAAKRGKQQERARAEQGAAADDGFRDAQIAAKRSKEQQKARAEQGAAADAGFLEAQLEAARGKQAQKANLEQGKAADAAYLEEQLSAARGKAKQRANLEQGLAVDAEYLAEQVAAAQGKAAQRASLQTSLAADDAYTASAVEAARGKARQAQNAQEGIAVDEEYIQATAAAGRARQVAAAKVSLAEQGQSYAGFTGEETIARAAIVSRAAADQSRAAAARMVTDEDIASMARRRAEEAKLNASIRQRERAYIKDAIKSGELQERGLGGTRFQRLQARFGTQAGKTPADYQTVGQFAGQKLTQTVGYGITGAATGALFFGVGDLLKDASELESTFVRLQGQLQGLGKAGEFDQVREGIKGIAVDTGLSANEVTDVTQRLIGVYGGDTTKAINETSAAMKLAVVAGLDVKTTLESVVPTAQAFGLSMQEIGDISVGVADKYGITADQFVQFAGKAAVVSKEAGLSIRELAIISGNMSQKLGVSLETSAETFNKLPELIQRNQTAIYDILSRQLPPDAAAQYTKAIQDELAAGRPGQAAIKVLEASQTPGFNDAGRVELAQEITVNREIEQGTAILKTAPAVIRDLRNESLLAGDSVGKLNKRFESMSDTVAQTFKRIGRAMENFAETLYSSGLSDVFATIGSGIELLITSITALAGKFKELNDLTKFSWGLLEVPSGVLNTIIKLGVVSLVSFKALQFLKTLRKGDSAVDSAAENSDAEARTRTASAANEAAVSIERQAAARSAGIPPAVQSAEVENAEAAARERVAAAANTEAGATNRATGTKATATAGAAAAGPLPTVRRAVRDSSGQWVDPATGTPVATPAGAASSLPTVRRAVRDSSGQWVDPRTGSPVATPVGARGGTALPSVKRAVRDSNGNWVDPATGAPVATPRGAEPGFAGSKLPVQSFGFLQKATYGGSFLNLRGSNAAAEAAGRSVGGAAGSGGFLKGLKPNEGQGGIVAAMAIAGAVVVKDAYDSEREKIQTASDEARERLKKSSREYLERVSNEHTDFLERFSLGLFGQDLPEVMAEQAKTQQDYDTSGVGKRAQAIAGNADISSRLQRDISDKNLQTIEGYFEQSDTTENLARDLGLQVEDPSLANRGLSIAGSGFGLGGLADKISYEGGNVTLTRENLGEAVKRAQNLAATGTDPAKKEAAQKFLQSLDPVLIKQAGMENLKKDVDAAVAANDIKGAVTAAGGGAEFVDASFDTLKKQFEAGTISTGNYLKQMKTEGDLLRQRIASGALTDQERKKALDRLAAIEKENSKVADGLILNRVEAATTLAELQGSDNSAGVDLAARLAALPTLTHNGRLDQLPKLLEDLKGSFEAELNGIADPLERARRRLAGFQIPTEVQDLFAEQQIANTPELQATLETIAPLIGMTLDQTTAWVVKTMRENKSSMEEVVLGGLQDQRGEIVRQLSLLATAGAGGSAGAGALQAQLKAIDEQSLGLLKSMGSGAAGQAIIGLSGYYNETGDQMAAAIIERARAEGVSYEDAFKEYVKERRQAAYEDAIAEDGINAEEQAHLDYLDGLLNGADASFQGTKVGTTGGTGKVGDDKANRRGVLETENAKRKLDIDSRVSMQPRNNLAKAEADVDKAMADVALEQAAIAQGANGDTSKLQEAQNRLRDAQSGKVEAVRDIEDAQMSWTEILAGDDPVAQNAAQMQQAQVNLLRAHDDGDPAGIIRAQQEIYKLQQGAADNQQAIIASRLSVQAAIFERDPVKSAQIALQQAEAGVANAEGEAARNEAEAARIRAAHGLEDALSALIESRANLAIAYADAAGDTVRSAEIGVEEAQRKLDEARGRGAAEGEINALTGSLVTANANLFRTRLSEEQETIDFMREMGQITLAQALSGYRSLLSRTQEGTDEYRNLMRAIKSMEDEAGADFQFNLPTTLGLPTLYEARRTNQSMTQGIGYQDNRNVVVSIAVNGTQDPAAVAQQVSSALQSSLRGGNTFTSAIPVGA